MSLCNRSLSGGHSVCGIFFACHIYDLDGCCPWSMVVIQEPGNFAEIKPVPLPLPKQHCMCLGFIYFIPGLAQRATIKESGCDWPALGSQASSVTGTCSSARWWQPGGKEGPALPIFSFLREGGDTYFYVKKKTLLIFKKVHLFILRERECKWGRKRERGRESPQAGSALSAWSPVWGLNSWTVRSWPELRWGVGCLDDWATQAPPIFLGWNLS